MGSVFKQVCEREKKRGLMLALCIKFTATAENAVVIAEMGDKTVKCEF